MYRITHDQDTYIAVEAVFENEVTEDRLLTGTRTFHYGRRLTLTGVTHINDQPIGSLTHVDPIQLGPGDTVTIEPVDPTTR